MNQDWILQKKETRRVFSNATWVPLRACINDEKGEVRNVGYVSECFSCGTVAFPPEHREVAEQLSWSDIGIGCNVQPYAYEDGNYSSIEQYQYNDKEPIGIHLVFEHPQPVIGGSLWVLNPDLIVVIAFKLLPESIFNIPVYGTMNLHASLLPEYRGAAPIQRAILNGEKKTGVTTFFINEGIDTGKIIIQKKLDIQDDDNSGIIHDKLSEMGGNVVLESIDHIENKKELIKQEEGGIYAKKIKKNELQINWNDSAANIFNKVRAFSPNPSSFSYLTH